MVPFEPALAVIVRVGGVTDNIVALLVLVEKVASPPYVAVIALLPTVVGVSVQLLAAGTANVHVSVALVDASVDVTVTVPLGVPSAGGSGATLTETCTELPSVIGPGGVTALMVVLVPI